MKIEFGNIGVCVQDYTKESLYELLEEHGLESLIDESYLRASKPLNQNMYLQSEVLGPYIEDNPITVNSDFIHYVTDMENYLYIVRVGILDPDVANDLIKELYLQGLIKPRNSHETN